MTWSGAVKKLVSFLTPVVEKHLHQDVENYQEQPVSTRPITNRVTCSDAFAPVGLHILGYRFVSHSKAAHNEKNSTANSRFDVCFYPSDANGKHP